MLHDFEESTREESAVDAANRKNDPKHGQKSCCLTVTQIPVGVFVEEKLKKLFEEIFKEHGEISVIYLKSFCRARIVYKSDDEASKAKDNLHGYLFQESQLGVYFTQIPDISKVSQSASLELPPPTKQYLISPPASPPVGWEPITEASPVTNHDILAAIAQLRPEEPYEAHPPSESHPSIMVHWCADGETENQKDHPLKHLPRHMVQTRKPDTKPNQ